MPRTKRRPALTAADEADALINVLLGALEVALPAARAARIVLGHPVLEDAVEAMESAVRYAREAGR